MKVAQQPHYSGLHNKEEYDPEKGSLTVRMRFLKSNQSSLR